MNRSRLLLFLIQGGGLSLCIVAIFLVRELSGWLRGPAWKWKIYAWYCMLMCIVVFVSFILWTEIRTDWVWCVFSMFFYAAIALFCNSYRMMLKNMPSIR